MKQDIFDLIDRFENSSLTDLKLTTDTFTLELGRSVIGTAAVPVSISTESTSSHPKEDLKIIKSPLVGTFYKASSPDSEPYVTPGKKVKKGQTLCILEAMKAMNEVPAPFDCIIEEVLVSDGDLIGYGDGLFRFTPC